MTSEDFYSILRIISVFFIGTLAGMTVVWLAHHLIRTLSKR